MQYTLVLLPGLDGTGILFEPFITALGGANKVKVISYPTNEPFGYTQLISLVDSALPVDGPMVILGESFSGPIAISIAAKYPSRVRGLILCCTFARNPRAIFSVWSALLARVPIGLIPTRVLSFLLFGRLAKVEFRLLLERVLAQVSPTAIRARMHAVLHIDVTSKLAEIRVPILYLRAGRDRVVPITASQLVSDFCPDARIKVFPAPHGLLQAVPGMAANAVLEFIRSL